MTPEFAAGFNAGIEAARKAIDGLPRITGGNISTWDEARYRGLEQALTAISALTVPSDLIAVPREPSEAMALNAIEKCHLPATLAKLHHVKEIYRAMITATEPRG